MKADARPGGYVATGGHGGILGGVNHVGKPMLKSRRRGPIRTEFEYAIPLL